ncbi:MAG: hypothetical protein EOP19_15455 [Hyphomicrobiales bacterium]|nr:MAG: hypothetical protein EOP19_15455 [Hyphomicrobiales bacterium]
MALGLGLASPVVAADWQWQQEDFRDSYPEDWKLEEDNPIAVELGVRYWYSMGQHDMSVAGGNYSSRDTSHIVEGVLRVDEPATGWYGKGFGGYSAVISNDFSTPAGSGHLDSGEVRYYGADIGWRALGNETLSGGGFAGYQYWNDSPDMGRQNFTGPTGGDSKPNKIEYHMLRLGLTTKANLGDMFDIEAEVAAVPYAMVQGQYGAFVHPAYVPPGGPGSPGTLSGWLYGASAEVMARFRPDKNWSIGLGGRAWYLTGQADFTFSENSGGTQTNYITKTQQYSTFRYGLLGEVSYRF